MRLLEALRETPIGRALIAYFVDLPRWTLLNLAFAVALMPSTAAALQGEVTLTLVLSFPAALVMAGLLRLLSVTVHGSVPRWSQLREPFYLYRVTLSTWAACVLVSIALYSPLLYLAVIPGLVVLLVAPLVMCSAALLPLNLVHAWRNGFVLAVHYPMVALGVTLLVLPAAWGVVESRGALVLVLPGLWAAIAVYTVNDLIQSVQKDNTPGVQ